MRSHFFSYLKDNNGIPVEGATIHVLVYPLGGGTASYAYVYLTESGDPTTTFETALTTDSNGYFEFWFSDKEEGGVYGYEYQREFKITWSGSGITSGSVDKIQLFDVTKREVDTTSTGTNKNRLVSNILAKGWEEHKSNVTVDHHTQYLKTDGSRFLTGNWDIGTGRAIIGNTFKSRPGAALNLTNYSGDGMYIDATTGKLVISTVSKLAGLQVYGNSAITGNLSISGTLGVTGATTMVGLLTAALVDINSGNIDGTAIGAASPSTGVFTSITAPTMAGTNLALTGSLSVGGAISVGTDFDVVAGQLQAANVQITGGTIDNTTIGQTIAAAGKFTTLECDNLIAGGIGGAGGSSNEAGAFSATSLFSYTFLKTGTLTVSGNTTLGDASGDTLTITGTVISCPNGLNFDSGTLYINASSNLVSIGALTGTRKLEVTDSTELQLRLSHTAGSYYADLGSDLAGNLIMSSANLSAAIRGDFVPYENITYNIGNPLNLWKKLHAHRGWFQEYIATSASYFRSGDGWMTIGASATPTAPIDNLFDAIRIRTKRTISSSSDPGLSGEFCWDADYLYICVDTDTWTRIALAW